MTQESPTQHLKHAAQRRDRIESLLAHQVRNKLDIFHDSVLQRGALQCPACFAALLVTTSCLTTTTGRNDRPRGWRSIRHHDGNDARCTRFSPELSTPRDSRWLAQVRAGASARSLLACGRINTEEDTREASMAGERAGRKPEREGEIPLNLGSG